MRLEEQYDPLQDNYDRQTLDAEAAEVFFRKEPVG